MRVEARWNRVHDTSRDRLDVCGVRFEGEREHAPIPRRALHDEVSVHQAREIPADGKAKPRATGANLRVALIERIEDSSEVHMLYARPGVFDGDRNNVPVYCSRARRGSHGDPSMRSELDGIAHQVDGDLPN